MMEDKKIFCATCGNDITQMEYMGAAIELHLPTSSVGFHRFNFDTIDCYHEFSANMKTFDWYPGFVEQRKKIVHEMLHDYRGE